MLCTPILHFGERNTAKQVVLRLVKDSKNTTKKVLQENKKESEAGVSKLLVPINKEASLKGSSIKFVVRGTRVSGRRSTVSVSLPPHIYF